MLRLLTETLPHKIVIWALIRTKSTPQQVLGPF